MKPESTELHSGKLLAEALVVASTQSENASRGLLAVMTPEDHLASPSDEQVRSGDVRHNFVGEDSVRVILSRTAVFVTNTDGFGGSERHTLELLKRLQSPDLTVVLLQVGKDVYTEQLAKSDSLGAMVRRREMRNSPLRWFRFFRETRPDLVVFVNNWICCFPWYTSLAACVAGVRKQFAIHHSFAPSVEKVKGWSVGSLFRRLVGSGVRRRLAFALSTLFLHETICVSNAVRNRLVSDYRFPANRTITIHNGVSIVKCTTTDNNRLAVRVRLGLTANDFVLVSVARLSEEKGIDILLLAMEQVVRVGLNCKCIIVGDGPLQALLLGQTQALGLSGHVFFEGFREDPQPYLQAADIFVLTSYREGLPLAVLEAMACGLPCLVTDVGGNAEAVTHGVHGLVVPPGSVDAVSAGISYLASHPNERAEMSKMSTARVHEEFDIEDRMAEIKRIILN